MGNELDILAIADSHLVLHLLGPDEADVPQGGEGGGQALPDGAALDSVADEEAVADVSPDFLPDNLVEDFLDEAADMLEELEGSYTGSDWQRAAVFGFVDGVLAVADGSWSALEDAYYEDADNGAFAAVDAAIDRVAEAFEGERPWDEAAKGHVRKAATRPDGEDVKLDPAFWSLLAHGFMYGADAAYDLEWKVVVTPANNILITDEDAMNEAALARLEAESGGRSLMDRVFDMIGIDPDEIAVALSDLADEDEAEDEGDADGEHADEQTGES